MLTLRQTNLLLIGLVFLLGVQLTGLTCLDEWQVTNHSIQAEIVRGSASPEASVLDHGCPCHFVFQSVSLTVPESLSLLTENVSSTSALFVPTFIVFLFHPPLSV